MALKINPVIGPGCPGMDSVFAAPYIRSMAVLGEKFINDNEPKHSNGEPIDGFAVIVYQLVGETWIKTGQADLGEFGEEGPEPYRSWAEKKCRALIENVTAKSSFELRDEKTQTYGGGDHVISIDGEEYIIAVSAFSEEEDEALVLVNCEQDDRFADDLSSQFVVISGNESVGYVSELAAAA